MSKSTKIMVGLCLLQFASNAWSSDEGKFNYDGVWDDSSQRISIVREDSPLPATLPDTQATEFEDPQEERETRSTASKRPDIFSPKLVKVQRVVKRKTEEEEEGAESGGTEVTVTVEIPQKPAGKGKPKLATRKGSVVEKKSDGPPPIKRARSQPNPQLEDSD